jgi:Flp pilus assembly pilin Flp
MKHHMQVLHVSIARWRRSLSVHTRRDRGASAVGYGLIGALITAVILMVVVILDL